jgi:hypothetical protein
MRQFIDRNNIYGFKVVAHAMKEKSRHLVATKD